MPLKPEDVSNKRFTPVRLREGYDMGEVDQFLDEVEAELERLLKENDDLGSKLAAATGNAPAAASTPAPGDKAAGKSGTAADKPTDASGSAAPSETIKVVTAAEASSAALRLLELATKNSDEVVAEAKQEAEQIVGTARTEAERLESDTKTRTEALEQEARARAQNLDAETEAKRSELLGAIEQEKARLDGEVDTLRAFEREYRSRLKSYFTEQLQALDGLGEGGEVADPGDSRRLRSVLGEPGDHESASGTPDPDATPGDQQAESPKA
ncbi:MAG: DivIVA family protein [Marmoricola sp.]|nr:DivIVA family protein [Marmoricola sp.]